MKAIIYEEVPYVRIKEEEKGCVELIEKGLIDQCEAKAYHKTEGKGTLTIKEVRECIEAVLDLSPCSCSIFEVKDD